MKHPASKMLLVLAALAMGGLCAVPAMPGAEKEKAAPPPKKEDPDLQKYDKNQNGKLDPDEKAAMEADQRKAREKKK